MGRKIVFFDIDGTLVNHNKEILESTKKAVRELQRQGVYTAIATGRTPILFENIRKELNIESYVALNGQYAVFEGQVIYESPIHTEDLAQICTTMKENGDAYVFVNHEDFKSSETNNAFIQESFGRTKIHYPDVDDRFYEHSPVYQAIVFCEDEQRQKYIQNFPQFTFLPWHSYAADFIPVGSSKAIGIAKMLEHGNFEHGNSYAFGDNNNDLEMLTLVGTGVAMGNALPETKAVADHITTSCEEDGIYHGLVDLGLIQPILQK
ncbi:hydrolase Cof [Paenibacillus selenitireducens]|uniref:Hydrolase Cof n=1 Tax=Paenibacillus selenitireducens TaxID=1324314 RepID=A0A1T2XD20_9BACL|nr:Cof-type HAD-IIB family hydrolase [Paenibacillus selenitireducens]OPA77735.1 hydrolase Cof [Paenibacillus selenitireducens]